MTRRQLYLIFILSIICYSCDYYDDRLKIINKTQQTIYFDYSTDTIFPCINSKEVLLKNKLDSGDSINVLIPGSTKKWIFNLEQSKDSTLRIYIFDLNTIQVNSLDSLNQKTKYRRIDNKLNELNKKQWRVTID